MTAGFITLTWKQNDRMEWHHTTLPMEKKLTTMPSTCKVMGTVVWSDEGRILVEVLPQGETINTLCYHQTPLNLLHALCATKKKIILQHNNAQPHSTYLCIERFQKTGCELVLHPPYCMDLAPLDYNLFEVRKGSDARSALGNQ
jgi:hypothetical protein